MSSHWQPPIQEHAPHQVFPSNSSTFLRLAPPSLLTDRSLQCQVAPFDMFPDDDLLSIFDFHVREDEDSKNAIEAWQSLVHVCQRWRSLVFESPRRLNLRLVCTPITPVKDLLNVWPALPLCVYDWGYLHGCNRVARKNEMIAALKNSDRIRQLIILDCNQWQFREFWAAMQVPFPELTELYLRSPGERASVVSDSFLGGFAPRLRHLKLESIPFPGLPKLLLSATHLVNLHLLYISDSGYISPEAMVTCLSMLTSLSELTLKFDWESSRQPHPDHESQHLTPPTRTVLPSLKCFTFGGDIKYLDDLVANIDVPQVSDMMICFPKEIDFDSPQLVRLINRTQHLGAPKEACVDLTYISFMLTFYYSRELHSMQVKMEMKNGLGSDRLVSDLARACISSLPPLSSSVEKLSIRETGSPLSQDDDIVNASWLELLRPFTAVRNLHLSGKCALHIARALDGDRATEVLPALENIFLSNLEPFGLIPQGIRQFVSARQLTGHSITVSPRMWQYSLFRR